MVQWKAAGLGAALFSIMMVACADFRDLAPAPPGELANEALAAPSLSCEEGACAPKNGSTYFEGEPGAGLIFFEFGQQRNQSHSNAVLSDILTHLPSSYGSTYYDSDPITHGHETSHGIHSDLRNNHNRTGSRANGFYVLRDRGVIVKEPNIRKSQITPYVPQSLQGSRFDLYVRGSSSWDDTPLYIWDEWNAYVNGSEVGVDMVNNGQWTRGWRDGVAGTLEFVVYALATAMAVEENDPGYFQGEQQFLEFLAWNTFRSMEVYREGAVMEEFTWDRQDAYLEAFRNNADAATMRAFAQRIFGTAWANTVLFGDGGLPGEPPPDDGDGGENPPDTTGSDDDDAIGGDPDLNNDDNDDNDDNDNDSNDSNDNPPAANDGDVDGDGVDNRNDLCSRTPPGQIVWTFGEWIGCAGGEFRDPVFPRGADSDNDGVPDSQDLCGQTASALQVWTFGEWMGCSEGEYRDRDLRADKDSDGIPDDSDRCSSTVAGVNVWNDGPWQGCSEGQTRD